MRAGPAGIIRAILITPMIVPGVVLAYVTGLPLLLALDRPGTLPELVAYPIITYELGYTGRAHIDDAFARVQSALSSAQGDTSSGVLSAGDAIHLNSQTPHTILNRTDSIVEAIWLTADSATAAHHAPH